jgi:dTDP-4-dehydrorhamnose 3,5-epimerase
MFDVALDVRRDSGTLRPVVRDRTHCPRIGECCTLPAGIAHGFQTLEDASVVSYQISEVFHPESARGIRWNDPSVAIRWPIPDNPIISERDRAWPDWPSAGE